MLLASALGYSTALMLVRVLTELGVPIGLSISSRACMQTLIALVSLRFKGLPLLSASNLGRRLQFVRSTCGSMSFVLYYLAASTAAPLGDISTIVVGLSPVLVMMLAFIWFGERVSAAGCCAVVMSAIGCALVSMGGARVVTLEQQQGDDARAVATVGSSMIGYAAAVLSLLCFAFVPTSIRRAGSLFHPVQGVALHSMFTSCTGAVLWLAHSRLHSINVSWATAAAPMLAMMVVAIGAQFLLSYGQSRCGATLGTVCSTTEIAWSYLMQLAVLRQPSSGFALVGAALVFTGVMLPVVEAARKQRCAGPEGDEARLHKPAPAPLDEAEPVASHTTSQSSCGV